MSWMWIGLSLNKRSTDGTAWSWAIKIGMQCPTSSEHLAIRRDNPKKIAIELTNCDVSCTAEPRRILCNRIQHRLNIGRRAGDDTRISLVAVCCSKRFLEFLEQPHVLDGDHGLVGEGFKKLDLRRGEGANLDATRVKGSDEFSLLTKGN